MSKVTNIIPAKLSSVRFSVCINKSLSLFSNSTFLVSRSDNKTNSKKFLIYIMAKKRIILKFIFVIFLIIIFGLFIFYLNNNNIIESHIYEDFDKIAKAYSNNKFFKSFLDQVKVLRYIYTNCSIENKNILHISLSLTDNYAYIILVSMESILLNCNKNKTFIIFHILCSPDITELSISMIKSLMKKFSSNMRLIFYGMGNNFIDKKDIGVTQASYYRLILPIIVNKERIIYLDGDTLSLKDLTEMYNSNFDNNYVLGFLGLTSDGLDYYGIKANNWINAGVLLLNLKKIREDNKCFDLLNLAINGTKLFHQDNTVINLALYPKIGKLPIKYGIWNFFDKLDIIKYSKRLRQAINISEYEEGIKDPGLIHIVLCHPKAWNLNSHFIKKNTMCQKRNNCDCTNTQSYNLWHYYAKKTDYYSEIFNYLNKKYKKIKF